METPFGIVLPNDKRIHIFIDNLGNNLLTTIPQGISNAQYVVHVLYPMSPKNSESITYSVKQKTGSFNSSLNFRNASIKTGGLDYHGLEEYTIGEKSFQLSTSSDNITFDLIMAYQNDNRTVTRTVVENYTIIMSPTYHGSFDVGLVRTELNNPTYSLVNAPTGDFQTVKITDTGKSTGVVTVMASFYYSPVIMLEKLAGKKFPFYKTNGRNFLDDHEFYERFYPTIGVGVNEKAFQNLFYGINWEIVRGLSLFGGWHYGKVNDFGLPAYVEGLPVTASQFEYYKRTRWKTDSAFGIKLDLLVFKGLFGVN
ncbi:MAG TPA: hypothetical protein PLI38_12180 [Flavobacterium sp.]|nr:hypothetical protein [Flavobacterium sp.]